LKKIEKSKKENFITKVAQKLMNKHPKASKESIRNFLDKSFGEKHFSAKEVCGLYKSSFEELDEEVKNCPQRVENSRKHYKKLNEEDQRKFILDVTEKIRKNHPNSSIENVRFFLLNIFGTNMSLDSQKVCDLYYQIFNNEQ